MKKGQKAGFFAPDKLDNHTIEVKGKNKQIERAKRKKGEGKKKAMVAPIVLTFSTLQYGKKKNATYNGNIFIYYNCCLSQG